MNATEALKVLGIEKKFPIELEIVKKRYREKAKENHPDISGNEEQMKKINEAYDWLNQNLEKVNQTNTTNSETKTKDNNNHFRKLDDVIAYFLKWYPIQPDIEKRKLMVDTLLKSVELYKFEDKLKNLKI